MNFCVDSTGTLKCTQFATATFVARAHREGKTSRTFCRESETLAAAGLQLKKFLPALQIAPPGFLCHASGDKVRRDRFTNTLLAVVGRKTVARARFFSSPLAAHRDLGDEFVPMW